MSTQGAPAAGDPGLWYVAPSGRKPGHRRL